MHVRELDEHSGVRSGELADESSSNSGPEPAGLRTNSSSANDTPSGYFNPALALLVEEITRRLQNGEDVDLDDYQGRHPEWVPTLRSLFVPLRALALAGRTVNAAPPPVPLTPAVVLPITFGDFIVHREVGRGGMGIVYEAEQVSLGRRVALKILASTAGLDSQSSRRFQVEAHVAACLNHAHIIPVYAVGSHGDIPFYAMQFIEGASLAEIVVALRRFLDQPPTPRDAGSGNPAVSLALDLLVDRFGLGLTEPKPDSNRDIQTTNYVRAVVRLAAQAAEALDHAHEQGILHRDIKPANLLLDRAGKLWVSDFGLARVIGSDTMTVQGSLAGTLRYMSPEQIMGKRALVDRRSDLYSLGATVYELLTLEMAIDGQERWEILARIDQEEPRPIRRLNPAIPADLAMIVAKAMAKNVSDRYSTAQNLADDLRCFLEGRPVKARQASPWEQIIRWSRRNPAVASLLAALVAVIFVGFAAVTVQWRRAESEASRANQIAQAEAKARAAESGLRIQAQAQAAGRNFDHALELASRGDIDQGLLRMAEALRYAPSEKPELGRMARANLTSWADQVPSLRAIFEHQGPVHQAVFRSDSRAVLTGSADGTAQVWDASTGQPIGPPIKHGDQVLRVALSPDGKFVLTGGSDGMARLWNAATGQPAGLPLLRGDPIRSVKFSPDGRLFLVLGGDQIVRLWSTATGQAVGRPVGQGDVWDVDLSPDSQFLLTRATDGAARLWDAASGQPTGIILRQDGAIMSARFSPDQRIIATTCSEGITRLWNTATGQPVGPIIRHGTPCGMLELSPDGKVLLTADENHSARLWNTATGRPIGPIMRHASVIRSAAFSPDGKLVMTGSHDRTARLWDTATGLPVGSPLRHRLFVRTVSFSRDGKRVLTASMDGTAKLWDISAGALIANSPRIDEDPDEEINSPSKPSPRFPFATAAFSPDRDRVVLASQGDSLARLVETDTGQSIGPPMLHRWSWVRAVAFSPDGHLIATSSHSRGRDEAQSTDSTCQIWDAATARPCSPLLPHINYVGALAFRPDSKVLATGDYSGAVHLWDVKTGVSVGPPLRAGSIVLSLAFSPDGRILVAGTAESRSHVVLWDLAAGMPRGEPIHFKRNIARLAFSRDGKRLAVASLDTTARLVDVSTGRVIGESMPHAESVCGLDFSPDGRLLLTVCSGPSGKSAARLWNVATGEPVSPELAPGSVASGALAFSPDNQVFATGYEDGSVYVWDVASATTIGPPRILRNRVVEVAFRPDGRTLVAADDHGQVQSWPVPVPSDEPVEGLSGRAKVQSGLELDSTGVVVVLDPKTWHRYRQEIANPPPSASRSHNMAWHDARARDAEAVGDGFGARWHLDRMISDRPDEVMGGVHLDQRNFDKSPEGLLRARRVLALLTSGHDSLDQTVRPKNSAIGQGSGTPLVTRYTTLPELVESEVARAIERGPRDRVLDWLFQRAEDLRASGRPEYALLLLDRIVAAVPADWAPHARRADVLGMLGLTAGREAELERAIKLGADIPFLIGLAAEWSKAGRWSEAAALYDQAIAQGTIPYEVWQEAAVAHLKIDDQAGYRRVCETLRSRHPAKLPEPWVRSALAGVCALGPEGIGDDGKALTWAEDFLASLSADRPDRKHIALSLLGDLFYRAGRLQAAIDRINEGIATDNGETSLEDAAVLAMAYHKSGDRSKTREMLAKLTARPSDERTLTFSEAEATRLLRREAERLILDHHFPVDPFVR